MLEDLCFAQGWYLLTRETECRGADRRAFRWRDDVVDASDDRAQRRQAASTDAARTIPRLGEVARAIAQERHRVVDQAGRDDLVPTFGLDELDDAVLGTDVHRSLGPLADAAHRLAEQVPVEQLATERALQILALPVEHRLGADEDGARAHAFRHAVIVHEARDAVNRGRVRDDHARFE